MSKNGGGSLIRSMNVNRAIVHSNEQYKFNHLGKCLHMFLKKSECFGFHRTASSKWWVDEDILADESQLGFDEHKP